MNAEDEDGCTGAVDPGTRVGFAVVGVHRMVLDGMAAWSAAVPDLDLVADAVSVEQLLGRLHGATSAVVLGLSRQDGAALVSEVLLLKTYGLGVVLLSAGPGVERIDAALAAAVDGVVTLDQGLDTLADLLRRIAPAPRVRPLPPAGFTWTSVAAPCGPADAGAGASPSAACVPNLSEQERAVLLGYASGMTLSTVARQIGIRPSTAKEYLHRVKIKYREVGRPTYTKIDLANRVREDGFAVEVAG
ncbi:response regulator transcription factor [Actinospica durhamensis]|uniref:Response regulator transcription factor n=1 Tax=Actinospica durhamensis TaxID=1508375 RepID=A0A941EXQ9_9ACTN|nr:response regulator transcription factor [Actinospica durhamensis]MBR7838941.1 response regulator transcription factor [Actinospica durhamensis]